MWLIVYINFLRWNLFFWIWNLFCFKCEKFKMLFSIVSKCLLLLYNIVMCLCCLLLSGVCFSSWEILSILLSGVCNLWFILVKNLVLICVDFFVLCFVVWFCFFVFVMVVIFCFWVMMEMICFFIMIGERF